MKVKEESEKDGLKLNIQKTKIVASSPTDIWKEDRRVQEKVRLILPKQSGAEQGLTARPLSR